MEKINVILVDDHDLFRLGIRSAIEDHHADIAIVGEAKSGADFFALLPTLSVDLVLLDIMLPDMSGIEVASRLKTERPDLKILAISAENSTTCVEQMLQISIDGFISKLFGNANTLAQAIHCIMDGGVYYGRDISDIISRIYLTKKKTAQVTQEFSDVERQIIEYCHLGLSAKLIAARLDLSTRTVDWHKSIIFRKLGINSTIEMLQFALKNNIIKMGS